jgi:EmrB/QacA subfamily drug resistance transporter
VTVAQGAPAAGTGEELDPRRWIALAVVLTAAFMVLLDISIVNVAIPSIQRDLHASFSQIQFVLAGYQLAYAVVLITGGRLGDIVGRKRMFMLGVAGFTLASALCGLAQSPEMLVVSRIVQGLMAALMYPQVLSVIQVSFPGHERGAAFSIFGATIGLAVIAGPLLGGLLIAADIAGSSWRPIFLVNVPVGIGSLLAAWVLLHESRAPQAPRLDLIGVAVVSVGLFLLTYPLVEGRDLGWPWWVYLLLIASLPVLAIFVLIERRIVRGAGSPLVELRLFRSRSFTSGLVLSLFYFAGVPSFFFVFSITLQIGLGYSALHAGLTTLPFAVGSFIGSVLSTRVVPRLGRYTIHAGTAMITLGMAGVIFTIHQAGTDLRSIELTPALLVCGLGMGTVIAPLATVVVAAVAPRDAGSASGVLSTVQQTGGAIGVAIVGVIFFGLVGSRADTVSATVAPALRQQLIAAQLPPRAVDTVVAAFETCFHDRANAKDPSVEPPSCQAARQAAGPAAPAVQEALASAAAQALASDFEQALERALFFQIAVFALSFLLAFGLPNVHRQPRAPAAAAAH